MAWTGNGTSSFWKSSVTSAPQGLFTAPSRYTMFMHYRNTVVAGSTGTATIPMAMGNNSATVQSLFAYHHATAADRQAFIHRRNSGAFDVAQLTTTLQPNTWYRIGCRYDGTNITAWLNGTQETSIASADINAATDTAFGLLAYPPGNLAGSNFDAGTVAEGALWDIDLTDAEMASLGAGICPMIIRPDHLLYYASGVGPDLSEVSRLGVGSGSGLTVADHPPTLYWPFEADGDLQGSYFVTGVPVVTIAGVLTPIRRYTLSITEVTNGRNRLTCDVVSRDASNRPAVDAEVVVYLNGVRIFAGTIDSTTETGASDKLPAIVTRVSVNDFNSLADRRYLPVTLTAGTLKSMLTTLTTYLAPYGVTLDPLQVTGPPLDEQTYDYRQLTEILNDLATLSGPDYVWEIDYDKVLRVYVAGTVAAPFNVVTGDGNAIGDIAVDQTARTKYANRIIVRAGTASKVQKTESFTGDGVTTTFPLSYALAGYIPYTADGAVGYAVVNVSWGTTEALGGVSSGLTWTYDPNTQSITRTSGAPANGDTFSITYDVQFPITVIAEDLGEQATYGLLERLVEKPDVFDIAVAQAIADAELAIALERPNAVRYKTRRTGLKPGMTQTITIAARNINDTYLVTDMTTRDSGDAPGTLIREVTATRGTTIKPTWRETYKQWSGSGGAAAPVAAA